MPIGTIFSFRFQIQGPCVNDDNSIAEKIKGFIYHIVLTADIIGIQSLRDQKHLQAIGLNTIYDPLHDLRRRYGMSGNPFKTDYNSNFSASLTNSATLSAMSQMLRESCFQGI